MRLPALRAGEQNLIWLDGEALCVTQAFQAANAGQVPEYLAYPDAGARKRGVSPWSAKVVAGGREATLVRRCASQPFRRLWAWLCRRAFVSPELRMAGLLFRLQRHGVRTPHLLAVGQRHTTLWRTESFLLTQSAPGVVDGRAWLAERAGARMWTAERKGRWRLLRDAARLLRALDDAGCHVRPGPGAADGPLFVVQSGPDAEPQVALGCMDALRRGRLSPRRGMRESAELCASLPPGLLSRTDRLRLALAYLGRRRLGKTGKRQVRRALRGHATPLRREPLTADPRLALRRSGEGVVLAPAP
jgi:hypothetical protein